MMRSTEKHERAARAFLAGPSSSLVHGVSKACIMHGMTALQGMIWVTEAKTHRRLGAPLSRLRWVEPCGKGSRLHLVHGRSVDIIEDRHFLSALIAKCTLPGRASGEASPLPAPTGGR